MTAFECLTETQVLAEELAALKRRRAQARADGRALAQQEKNVKKRRARLLQAMRAEVLFFGLLQSTRFWQRCVFFQAARELSQDDLVLLLRQVGGALVELPSVKRTNLSFAR